MITQSSKRVSFNQEVVAALLLTAAGVLAIQGGWLLQATPLLDTGGNLNLWLSVLVGVYLLWLCSRSKARSGRPTLLLVWFAGTVAAGLLGFDLLLNGAWQLLMISITRATLFYPKPLALLLDLVLSAGAGLAAVWVSLHTGSLLLTLWTFFLLQASWTWIANWQTKVASASAADPGAQQFETAHATAVAAIRRLSSRQPF